jgi:hypothetical protein
MTQYDKSQGQFPKAIDSITQDGRYRNSQVCNLHCSPFARINKNICVYFENRQQVRIFTLYDEFLIKLT